MKAKGLGVIAVHFCFQLNEVMIMRAVVFCFEALLSKIQKAACDTTLWVDTNLIRIASLILFAS